MTKEKFKIIEQNINSAVDSLTSHLPWTYLKSTEGKKFHQDCVRQYAHDILNLSKLYTKDGE